MKKRIIAGVILVVLLFILTLATYYAAAPTVVAGQKKDGYTKEELITLITETQSTKDHCHNMALSAKELGWSDDDELIVELQDKWNTADEDQKKYQAKLNDIIADEQASEEARIAEENKKWEIKAMEYPEATYIWRYMKAQGWNDYVCAGIMGNLMAEVGGQTLNIRYSLSSSGYYGMCQWSRGYKEVWGAGLESQCDFLKDTIKYEFDTYGFKYQKGFNFQAFLNMNNAEQAALAFAKSYERCASGSYKVRQNNAIKAYKYFVG